MQTAKFNGAPLGLAVYIRIAYRTVDNVFHQHNISRFLFFKCVVSILRRGISRSEHKLLLERVKRLERILGQKTEEMEILKEVIKIKI
ncbi:MAG: hypothetical protein BGO28_05515 [Alphaproteobacteria bacterium 43-37]|nr:MAG: hypothetical protein BGO28_05515 [Alphaproteobacteria bacterium 43-37]